MDDLQLNISVPVKVKKKKASVSQDNNSSEYKFISKPNFTGKTIARKRKNNITQQTEQTAAIDNEPQKKLPKLIQKLPKTYDLDNHLRDLSQNKGKFKGKNYQQLSDDLQIKQKPRAGGWISSLFKNNPDVPRLGQRAVKPLIEKVFAGKTFSELEIHPHSVANLQQNLNLKELMTVQQNAIPVILQGRDVLIRSQTGSGKTLAYALPIVEGLQAIRPKINRHDGIRALIVVPTRELAVQTYELLIKLVKPFTWLVPGLLSGGQKRKAEKARLRKGLNILVGTPGRINDHLRHTKSLNFSKAGCLILDEADRLLDMGYEKDVAAIVKAIEDHKKAATYDPMALMKSTIKKDIPDEENTETANDAVQEVIKHHLTKVFLSKEHQTILLSATLTKAVENLAGITMVDPVFVDTLEGRTVVADSLKTTELEQANKSDDTANTTVHLEVLKDDNKSKKVAVESITETRKGLKAFNGISNLDLFQDDNTSKVKTSPIKTKIVSEESDSDSDYEYFKVQKELEVKEVTLQKDVKQTDTDNRFESAVKSAIVDDELVLPATVNQSFLIVPMKLRLVTLCALIIKHCVLNKKGGKMIVFMATLEMVDYHSDLIETVLTRNVDKQERKNKKKNSKKAKTKEKSSDDEFEIDYEVPSDGGLVPVEIDMYKLHGSMPHEQRMEIFKQFRAAKSGVLLCTDVAARGIDVPRVDLVLQYCAPASATDYVHRVGRTGRAAHVGAAVLFLLPSEAEFVRHLEQKRIRYLLMRWKSLPSQTGPPRLQRIARASEGGRLVLSNITQTCRRRLGTDFKHISRLRQEDERAALEALCGVAGGAAAGASGAARAAAALQARLELAAHANSNWLARASRAYTSWVRFYAGYPREVRPWLDAKQLHLGHAAKSFALRDTPAALARRSRSLPDRPDRPDNRLTVDQEKLPGFPKSKVGSMGTWVASRQSSMHTASEFDSGLEPLHHANKKKKKK